MKAWHFTSDTLRDGRPLPANGEVLRHEGPIEICKTGLHGSVKILDALRYAPGSTICRVDIKGEIQKQEDKICGRERVILWRIDGENLLREFARKRALDVVHLWDAPQVVVDYLKTGDESLSAAASAAVSDAAWDAASAAACAAARAAAWAAASDAVSDAAWDAASAAAWDAARAAAWAKQNRRLTAMVNNARKQAR